MKINKVSVVALRNSQNWTQEDLAAAAGVSVRTIQRVETMGTGSQETSKALAVLLMSILRKLQCQNKTGLGHGIPSKF